MTAQKRTFKTATDRQAEMMTLASALPNNEFLKLGAALIPIIIASSHLKKTLNFWWITGV